MPTEKPQNKSNVSDESKSTNEPQPVIAVNRADSPTGKAFLSELFFSQNSSERNFGMDYNTVDDAIGTEKFVTCVGVLFAVKCPYCCEGSLSGNYGKEPIIMYKYSNNKTIEFTWEGISASIDLLYIFVLVQADPTICSLALLLFIMRIIAASLQKYRLCFTATMLNDMLTLAASPGTGPEVFATGATKIIFRISKYIRDSSGGKH